MIGSEVCSHNFICPQSIEEQLKKKEDEIDTVKQLGTALISETTEAPEGSPVVTRTVEQINQQWANLDHQVSTVINMFYLLFFIKISINSNYLLLL